MSNNLLNILNELSSNPELESQYKQDPDSVMSKFELTDDEKSLLKNEDTQGIEAALQLSGDKGSIQKIIKLT
ncbi:hypothetical protein [Pleionea sediminis]|uniref:hypothetical protein n=1 Tax=Pleionea sediminis TaxID=2569479 RepID=UPI0011855A01|nr:hypothetical protein [Pleionea sediminis]